MSEPAAPRLLDGRVIVVVGAGSGIGQACASAAAVDGAHVVLADRDPTGLRHTVERLPSPGNGSAPVLMTADVTDEKHWDELMSAAAERYGRVDGLVMAAGIARHVPLEDMTLAQWEEMLAVHLTGAFLGLRAAAKAMSGGGSVVYIASTVATGRGPLHQSHYVAAKAGAIGLVRAAARELGPRGIRVNSVSPGFTRTPLNAGLFTDEDISARADAAPLGRVAEATDVADTTTFLLSERSRLTTGQDLRVDGGATFA